MLRCVGPPVSSSRLALEVAPSVNTGSRAVGKDRRRTAQGREHVGGTTGDRVDIAGGGAAQAVGARGCPAALGPDLEGGAGPVARAALDGQDDVAGRVDRHLAGARHVGVDAGGAVGGGRGATVTGQLVDVARGDAHAVEGARVRRENPVAPAAVHAADLVVVQVDVVRAVDEGRRVSRSRASWPLRWLPPAEQSVPPWALPATTAAAWCWMVRP